MLKKILLIAVSVLVGFSFTYLGKGETEKVSDQGKSQMIQQELAESLLRFHVLANSDSGEDQNLKLKVKTAIVEYLDVYLDKEDLTLAQAKEIVTEKKAEVIAIAENEIKENGYNYTVSAELVTDNFPVKSYGDVTLPAGEYEAFRIQIGEAQGKNWWCILYPPLCFVDASTGYVPEESKEMLAGILDKDCYETILNGGIQKGQVEVRFKLLDFIKEKCGR